MKRRHKVTIMIMRVQLCRMLCAFSKFQPCFSPSLMGRFDFNSSSSSTELSTYMSMMCNAYYGVTSTIVEEESNELKRSLRRVHTPLSIASDTKGLSGEVYSSGARRTCVYEYRVAGSICSPYRNW